MRVSACWRKKIAPVCNFVDASMLLQASPIPAIATTVFVFCNPYGFEERVWGLRIRSQDRSKSSCDPFTPICDFFIHPDILFRGCFRGSKEDPKRRQRGSNEENEKQPIDFHVFKNSSMCFSRRFYQLSLILQKSVPAFAG
jgi:hypothetical protein